MSLILDALRKLEREKGPGEEPGVLVVGSVPWGEKSKSRRLAFVLAGIGVLALAAVTGWRLASRPSVSSAAAAVPAGPPAEAQPTPLPPPSTQAPATAVVPEAPVAPPIRLSRPPDPGAAPQRDTSVATTAPVPPVSDAQPISAPAATVPAAGAPPSGPRELRLNAISVRDGRPVALINDRLVFVGDSFDGIQVLRIGDTEVEVEVDGERRILRF